MDKTEQGQLGRMDCPKCKTKNSVHGTYDYLDRRNRCWCCGCSHVPGIHRFSVDKQVTGISVFITEVLIGEDND